MKKRKLLIMVTIAMFPFLGAFGISEDAEPIRAVKIGKTP